LSNNGIAIHPQKVEAINQIPTPTTFKQLQQFIGAINYNRQFIPNIAELLVLLYNVMNTVKKGKIHHALQSEVEKHCGC
jgi:ACR3 family arsenite efflux pump ArsB